SLRPKAPAAPARASCCASLCPHRRRVRRGRCCTKRRCVSRLPCETRALMPRAIDIHVHPTDQRVARAWAGDLEEAERLFRGRQEFYPNGRRFVELFDTAASLHAPVLFHTGMMAAGAGTPGGRGQRLDFTRPIYLDHLAADFPTLTIIAAHPSWPWADEGLAV